MIEAAPSVRSCLWFSESCLSNAVPPNRVPLARVPPPPRNRLPKSRLPGKPPGKPRAPAKSRAKQAGKGAARGSESSDLRERLQKVLAAAGVGSRRACEELISEGRVEVDRQVVVELGTRVDLESQEVRVDGEVLLKPKRVYYMVNKLEGVVSTARDQEGRPRVTDMIPPKAGRLFSVGRLDMASEGLILLTNDGELANLLTHPRYGVEKTYHVEVAGHPEREVLSRLRSGVHLAEGLARVVRVRIKTRRKQSTILEMVLDEGRNREIRRLLARVGHRVLRLTRVAVGTLRLGDLPAGAYRPLTRDEVRSLRHSVTNPSGKRPAPSKQDAPSKQPPISKKPTLNRQSTSRKPTGKSATGKSATGKSATGKSATGKSATGKSATGKSATGKSATGKSQQVIGNR